MQDGIFERIKCGPKGEIQGCTS